MEGLNLFESNILLWIQENLRINALDSLMPLVSAVNNAAHYPTDVLVGMLIGTLTSILAYKCVYVRWFKRKLGD